MKDDPIFTGQPRLKADAKWGLPLKGGWGQPLTFLIAAPSDAQEFDNPIQGPTWWMRGMTRDKKLIVVVPEITFSVPQMFSETESGYKRDQAGIATDPAMILEGAMVYTSDAKGTANIQIQRHGKRFAAEVTGTIVRCPRPMARRARAPVRAAGILPAEGVATRYYATHSPAPRARGVWTFLQRPKAANARRRRVGK